MNGLDIVLLVILVASAIHGYVKGFLSQAFGVIGLLLGIWLGYRFSARLAVWFDMSAGYANLLCFIIILLMAIVVSYLVGKIAKKIFKMTGFGMLDRIGGLTLSLIQAALVLCLLLGLFVNFNKEAKIVNPKVFEQSALYKPLQAVGNAVFPWILDSTSRLFNNDKQNAGSHKV